MTDQFAGHEIARHEITRQEIARHENAGHENAGHENDVPKMTIGREMAGEKSTVSTEIMNELCKFLNPQHCNTLCIREGA